MRGRKEAAIGRVDCAGVLPEAGERGQKRIDVLQYISEDADDGTVEYDQSNFLHRRCDGISIKSRTQSRQGECQRRCVPSASRYLHIVVMALFLFYDASSFQA